MSSCNSLQASVRCRVERGSENKVGEGDERDARESSPQPGRRLTGGKVTGHKKMGGKTMRTKETGDGRECCLHTGHGNLDVNHKIGDAVRAIFYFLT